MVDTIKFSEMTAGGDLANDDKTPGLLGGANVLFNNPWTFLPPGTTAQRPLPSAAINFRLRFNTEEQLYEYYDAVLGAWTQLQESLFTQGPFLLYTADASIPDGQNLGALANGILKQTVALGVATLDIAVNGTDFYGPGSDIDLGNAFKVINALNPVQPQDYATKAYVDAVAVGLNIQAACECASTTALTATYANGASGVGATLTNAGAMVAISLDGIFPTVGQRVLIKNQASSLENGIYTVTVVGSAIQNWELTRATDFDTPAEIQPGDFVPVLSGTVQAGSSWLQTAIVTAVGTDPITFIQFSASIPLTVPNGGTGTTSFTAYGVLTGGTTSTSPFQAVTPGATGTILQSGGAAALPTWSTATFPSTATGIGTFLRADGTNWVASTLTIPNTASINTIPYASSANVWGEISAVNSAVLISSAGGVPSMSTTLPAALTIPQPIIQGITNASSAAAGQVGEVISNSASGVSLTSTIAATVTSINLTAGKWTIIPSGGFTPAAGTLPTNLVVSVNTTTNTLPASAIAINTSYCQRQAAFPAGSYQQFAAYAATVNISSTTTFYLVLSATFTVSTLTGSGVLWAIRVQ